LPINRGTPWLGKLERRREKRRELGTKELSLASNYVVLFPCIFFGEYKGWALPVNFVCPLYYFRCLPLFRCEFTQILVGKTVDWFYIIYFYKNKISNNTIMKYLYPWCELKKHGKENMMYVDHGLREYLIVNSSQETYKVDIYIEDRTMTPSTSMIIIIIIIIIIIKN
jgi:hypothetical protein